MRTSIDVVSTSFPYVVIHFTIGCGAHLVRLGAHVEFSENY